jgi:hypothetical protein
MTLLFVFVGLIGLPIAAAKGAWHRGVYLALAIGGFLAAAILGQVPMGVNTAAGITTSEQAQAADAIIMAMLSTAVGVAIGGLLGACLYRANKPEPATGQPPAN